MANGSSKRATLDDLARVEGRAELVRGRIVRFESFGHKPACAVMEILSSLFNHAEFTGCGEVFTSTLAYTVPELPSGRESFCPAGSYYLGPLPDDPMAFIAGAPTFAIEVRGENDYGPAAERAMAAKRADYFAAGTRVVWDVDPVAEAVHVYRSTDPDHPTTYTRGQEAEAEPAAPGWRVAVDAIFRSPAGEGGVAYPVTVNWREHGKGVTVTCSDDLALLLDRIASECDPDRPQLVMIDNESGSLAICVGAPVSMLSHIPPSGDPPYMICLGDADADGVMDFYYLGHHGQFLMRNTIPNELARAAALEYAESGKLPDSVAWEEV